MKLVNNNISPLPFYDSLDKQNHRKDYAFGHISPLITYGNFLVPFQIVVSPEVISINRVTLVEADTRGEAKRRINIPGALGDKGVRIIRPNSDYAIISYPALLPITEIPHEGYYWLEMSLMLNPQKIETIYSDIFSVVYDVSDFLLIKYRNLHNFTLKDGEVDFSDGFEFKCYLCTQVGKPEYSFEEEATERMGYTFVESQVSKKVYKFTFVAPEYLCDALRIVRLCSEKQIISKGDTYDALTFSMEPKWEDQGDLASVECEFETDTVIAVAGGFALSDLGRGDFNNDFGQDYLI